MNKTWQERLVEIDRTKIVRVNDGGREPRVEVGTIEIGGEVLSVSQVVFDDPMGGGFFEVASSIRLTMVRVELSAWDAVVRAVSGAFGWISQEVRDHKDVRVVPRGSFSGSGDTSYSMTEEVTIAGANGKSYRAERFVRGGSKPGVVWRLSPLVASFRHHEDALEMPEGVFNKVCRELGILVEVGYLCEAELGVCPIPANKFAESWIEILQKFAPKGLMAGGVETSYQVVDRAEEINIEVGKSEWLQAELIWYLPNGMDGSRPISAWEVSWSKDDDHSFLMSHEEVQRMFQAFDVKTFAEGPKVLTRKRKAKKSAAVAGVRVEAKSAEEAKAIVAENSLRPTGLSMQPTMLMKPMLITAHMDNVPAAHVAKDKDTCPDRTQGVSGSSKSEGTVQKPASPWAKIMQPWADDGVVPYNKSLPKLRNYVYMEFPVDGLLTSFMRVEGEDPHWIVRHEHIRGECEQCRIRLEDFQGFVERHKLPYDPWIEPFVSQMKDLRWEGFGLANRGFVWPELLHRIEFEYRGTRYEFGFAATGNRDCEIEGWMLRKLGCQEAVFFRQRENEVFPEFLSRMGVDFRFPTYEVRVPTSAERSIDNQHLHEALAPRSYYKRLEPDCDFYYLGSLRAIPFMVAGHQWRAELGCYEVDGDPQWMWMVGCESDGSEGLYTLAPEEFLAGLREVGIDLVISEPNALSTQRNAMSKFMAAAKTGGELTAAHMATQTAKTALTVPVMELMKGKAMTPFRAITKKVIDSPVGSGGVAIGLGMALPLFASYMPKDMQPKIERASTALVTRGTQYLFEGLGDKIIEPMTKALKMFIDMDEDASEPTNVRAAPELEDQQRANRYGEERAEVGAGTARRAGSTA